MFCWYSANREWVPKSWCSNRESSSSNVCFNAVNKNVDQNKMIESMGIPYRTLPLHAYPVSLNVVGEIVKKNPGVVVPNLLQLIIIVLVFY